MKDVLVSLREIFFEKIFFGRSRYFVIIVKLSSLFLFVDYILYYIFHKYLALRGKNIFFINVTFINMPMQ